MDKNIIANGVILDEGKKQGTVRASTGGLAVVRGGKRPLLRRRWVPRPEGRKEHVKKRGEHLRQGKDGGRAQGWVRCCLWLKCGS